MKIWTICCLGPVDFVFVICLHIDFVVAAVISVAHSIADVVDLDDGNEQIAAVVVFKEIVAAVKAGVVLIVGGRHCCSCRGI